MNTETPETQLPDVPEAEPGMSYLKSVHIKGFRTIRDLETEFLPGLNVIIGENGVGKTNFMEGIDELVYIDDAPFSSEADYGQFSYVENNNVIKIELERFINEKKKMFSTVMSINYKNTIFKNINEYKKYINDNKINEIIIIKYLIPFANSNEIFMIERSSISLNIYDKFPLKGLIPKFSLPFGSLDGIDLGISLGIEFKNVNLNSDNIIKIIYNEIEYYLLEFLDSVKLYAPIQGIRLDPNVSILIDKDQGNIKIDNLLLNFQVNGQWLPYDMLSDGTKRIVYIIAKIASAPANSIILLEEPELGIHPHQLYKLMTFIKEQSKEKQIILTTHSPEVLNFIEADELDRIQIAYLKKGAGTQLRRLTPAEQEHARAYMQELDLSDFWVHAAFEENPENAPA